MAGINPYYRRKVRVQKLGFKELEGVLKNEGTVRVSYKDGSAFLWDTAQDFSSVAIPSGATGKGTRRYKAYIFDASGYVISGFCDIEDTNYAVGADVVVNGTFAADAVGADVVVNGTFATDSDWVMGTGWTIADGKAVKVAGEASNLTASAPVANIAQGGLYLVNVKVACTTPGTLVVKAGNTNVGSIVCAKAAEEANFSFFYTEPTGNVKPTICADQNFAGTVDDLQFKSSDWVMGTGWTIADGKAVKVAGEASNLTASAPVANIAQGGLYLVNVKVACTTPGTLVVKAGNTNVGSIVCAKAAEEANFSFFYTEPTGNVKPTIFADQNFAGTVDDLQFKQVTHQNPDVCIQLFAAQAGGAQNIEGTVSIVPTQFNANSALTYKIIPLF